MQYERDICDSLFAYVQIRSYKNEASGYSRLIVRIGLKDRGDETAQRCLVENFPVGSISPGRASSWARVRADNLPCTARAISAGLFAERALNDTIALVIKNKLFTRCRISRIRRAVCLGPICVR